MRPEEGGSEQLSTLETLEKVQMLLLVSAVVPAGPPKPLERNKAAEAAFLVAFHLPGWFVPAREVRVRPSKPGAVFAQLCPLQCTLPLLRGSLESP